MHLEFDGDQGLSESGTSIAYCEKPVLSLVNATGGCSSPTTMPMNGRTFAYYKNNTMGGLPALGVGRSTLGEHNSEHMF